MKNIKFLALVLSFILLVSLFSCNDSSNSITDETVTQNTETESLTETDSASSTDTKETDKADESESVTTEETSTANSEEETAPNPNEITQNWDDDGEIKILCVGNSFSVDTMNYLYGILKDLGIEKIKLGNLAIAGCSVITHLSNAKNDEAAYLYYENTSGTWQTYNNYIFKDILLSENWDFISFQQASHDSGVEKTYSPLENLIDIAKDLRPGAKIVWNMTWAYQQDSTHEAFPLYNSNQMTMYKKIVSAVRSRVEVLETVNIISPTGTAIQNARAGWIGDTLTRDGFHLSDLGRYIAALTFAGALTDLSIKDVKYAPGSITAAEKTLATEAADLALQKPFEVSTPTAKAPSAPSIDDLYEIDTELERGYWAAVSTDGSHLTRIKGGSELPMQFYSTCRFTKETLPVGSIIIIESGWEYRPEGWIGTSPLPSSLRPGMVNTRMIVVDELWWGDFTERAFNVVKSTRESLENMTAEDISNIFKIYVPYDPSAPAS